MRILQLSPQFPYPLSDGGKISISHTCKAMCQAGMDVHMICLTREIPDSSLQHEFKHYTGASLTCIKHDTKNSIQAIVASLFDSKFPLYIRKHRSNNLLAKAKQQHQENPFDIILCDHTAMVESALALREALHIPAIVRLHNIEHRIWDRYAERMLAFNPIAWFVLSQAKKLKNFETHILPTLDYCLTINETEQEYLQKLSPDVKSIFVPPGIPIHTTDNTHKNPTRMIHATTYSWIHNVEAIDWFIEQVMPALKKQYHAELVLLGKSMPERYLHLQDNGIIGKGFVEDLMGEFNEASFYIAPLFVGGGIRIKILEAMGAGLPVLASPISAEGIHANHEQGLIICNTAQEFIDAASALLLDHDECLRLGNNARDFIKEHFSWEIMGKTINNICQNFLRQE